MFKWLKQLFKKEVSRTLNIIEKTPVERYKEVLLNDMVASTYEVWGMGVELNKINDEVTELLERRKEILTTREDLITLINKQRKVLGLSELDSDGIALPAEDETYALES